MNKTDAELADYIEANRERLVKQGVANGYWSIYLAGVFVTMIYILRNKKAHTRYWRVDD